MSGHAISCRDLVKVYSGRPPVEAVRGLSLDVAEGECLGVLGPNGAGKTTTIEMLEGLLPATRGEIEILGRHWGRDDNEIRSRIGVSLQETELSERLKVTELITLFRSFYGSRGVSVDEILSRVSLEEKASALYKTLSGGQKQRLALACALVGDPEILFLDEPTTGLDPQSRRQLWELIEGMRHQGRTVLLTTHYMDEAERLCDRVAIIDHGRIIASGSPRELIASLDGEHVIEFTLAGKSTHQEDDWTGLPEDPAVNVAGNRVAISVTDPQPVLPVLLQRISERRDKLATLTIRHASLDDVFVHLAGRHLAEEGTDGDAAAPADAPPVS